MRIFLFFIVLAITSNLSHAQEAKPGNTIPPAASVSKSVKVAKEGTVTGIRRTLVSGRLNFQKFFGKTDAADFSVIEYSLQSVNDEAFNNNQPVHISLNKKTYDSVFTKGSSRLAGKYAALNQFVSAKNISLDTEEGWIALIRYYNDL